MTAAHSVLEAYALEAAKKDLVRRLQAVESSLEDLQVQTPPPKVPGDLAVPLFRDAKRLGRKPPEFVGELVDKIDLDGSLFGEARAAGGFLNVFFDRARLGAAVLDDLASLGERYGSSAVGEGKTIVVDYSSPNIAKPFSVGHLRSTVIGQAICNLHRFLGYTVIGDNHIGDWGTQFGKLLYAYSTWGEQAKVEADPIPELLTLYVKFHEAAEEDPALDDAGRAWFQKLEDGDEEAVRLWKWFSEVSWKAFEQTYDLLGGVHFDEVLGEAFYNDKLDAVIEDAFDAQIIVFRGDAEWNEFLHEHPEVEDVFPRIAETLDVKRTTFTLTKKARVGLVGKGIEQDDADLLADFDGVEIEGQKELMSRLEKRLRDEDKARAVARKCKKNTVPDVVRWVRARALSDDDKAEIGPVALNEIIRSARTVAERGAVPGEEDSGEGGAAIIRLDEFGIEVPLLIQKSDGTSLYATRDLATIRHRFRRWSPAEIVYVVGGEQQLYFRQLFLAARLLGYSAEYSHPWFGLVRLPEGKMSTRKGNVILLEDVLSDAIRRAEDVLQDREMSDEEKREVARVVGVGAVKYADLSQDRTTEVIFKWDKMLALQGNSSVYLQYAAVRARSVLRKAEQSSEFSEADGGLLVDDKEQAVLQRLARFPEALLAAAQSDEPHLIANYLFALGQEFNTFYNAIPILPTEDLALRTARLGLCRAVGQVIATGLRLLGIGCPKRM